MPVTSQPTDQPYGQVIPDEKALERLFRAGYARWIADAKGRLGDASSAAPRVVSKAFHLAWQDRQRFRTAEELDAFLGANIHHGAARELSRRAGIHRMDAHEGVTHKEAHDVKEMTVDEAWERLQTTLHGGAPESQRQRASTARHGAAEHMAELGKEKTNYKPLILIGGVGLVIAIGALWWVEKAGASRAITNALAAQDVRPYATGIGQQANITLDDGTIVRLAPDTKLTVPRRFGIGLRAVKIEGAANFEVTRTLDQPFEVRVGDAAVIARGTNFTIRKYPDDPSSVVTVKEGTVEVVFGDATRNVAAGTSLVIANDGATRAPTATEISESSTWVDGNVSIIGRNLKQVLPQLKRWYGLDLHVEDTTLLNRGVFIVAPLNSPKEAIASVEKSAGVKFTYIGENMAFQDTARSRPARRR